MRSYCPPALLSEKENLYKQKSPGSARRPRESFKLERQNAEEQPASRLRLAESVSPLHGLVMPDREPWGIAALSTLNPMHTYLVSIANVSAEILSCNA